MEKGKTLNITMPNKGEVKVIVLDTYKNDGDIMYTCYSPDHHLLIACFSHRFYAPEDPNDYHSRDVEMTTIPEYGHIIAENCVIGN